MPILLPPGAVVASPSHDENVAMALPFLSEEDVRPLVLTALQAKRGYGSPPAVPLEDVFLQLLTQRQPALVERTRRFAAEATRNTLRAQQLAASSAAPGPTRVLYIMQHEWAVVAPQDGLHYLASDDATTCHLVGIRERGTGVTGLAHVDTPESVEDLEAMEAEVERRARACLGPSSSSLSSSSTTPLTLDLYLVGGFQGDAEAGLLTAILLRHFATTSPRTYHLQLSLASSLNTCPHPTSSLPSPICRSLGFALHTGQVFTGDLPRELREPMHTLRSLRLWGWGARNLIRLEYLPPSSLPAAKTPLLRGSSMAKGDSSSSTGSSSTSSSSSSSSSSPELETDATPAGGGSVVIAPFRYKASKHTQELLRLNDSALIQRTSTSPAIESPGFVEEIRAVLHLLSSSQPEQFFGPDCAAPAVVPLPLVDLQALYEKEDGEGMVAV